MPKPNIIDRETILNNGNIQPLADLVWDVFAHPSEDRPVSTVEEARDKLEVVAREGDTMTGPLTLPSTDPTQDDHAARKAYVDAQLDARLDALYPVGSIYFCTAATDPNGALPGTWSLLTEGQFLVSAGGTGDYALGNTGGAEEVTLIDAQMPSHTHNPTDQANYRFLWNGTNASSGGAILGTGSTIRVVGQTESGVVLDTQGGDQPHENRPPYLAVNMWQRTA